MNKEGNFYAGGAKTQGRKDFKVKKAEIENIYFSLASSR